MVDLKAPLNWLLAMLRRLLQVLFLPVPALRRLLGGRAHGERPVANGPPVPPDDWIERTRPVPPPDWVEKVRRGAPELLGPGESTGESTTTPVASGPAPAARTRAEAASAPRGGRVVRTVVREVAAPARRLDRSPGRRPPPAVIREVPPSEEPAGRSFEMPGPEGEPRGPEDQVPPREPASRSPVAPRAPDHDATPLADRPERSPDAVGPELRHSDRSGPAPSVRERTHPLDENRWPELPGHSADFVNSLDAVEVGTAAPPTAVPWEESAGTADEGRIASPSSHGTAVAPDHHPWPPLPDAPVPTDAHPIPIPVETLRRLDRLEREQKGEPWSA